jgi:pimeloyl-ACP methyl ester carboxylesterase
MTANTANRSRYNCMQLQRDRMRLIPLFLVLLLSPAFAADTLLDVQIKLKQPKKAADRTDGPPDAVPFSIFIPDGTPVVRGAIYNPFNLKQSGQKHWQEAARLWGFAVIGSNHFGVRNEEHAATLLAALKDAAIQTKRPELEHLPLCLVGMSAGSGMSMTFAKQIPDRVIALGLVCLEVGPDAAVPATLKIPTVTVFGEKDGRQMQQLAAKLPKERAAGAQWAIAVQWGRRHEFGLANNLVVPFFADAIRLRYPKDATPLNGPVKLLDVEEKSGHLADVSSWSTPFPTIAPYAEFKGNPADACWFPSADVAAIWRAFVAKEPKVAITSPLHFSDGKPFVPVPAGQPLDVAFTLPAGVEPKEIQLFEGAQLLATTTDRNAPIRIDNLPPGIHPLILVVTLADGTRLTSRPVVVIAPRPITK